MTFPPVGDLVPHSPPTLALDELVAWSPGRATLRTTIAPDSLLVRGDRVHTVAALEWMAQGVAACLGHEAFRGGGAVRVGMVIACRRMTLARDTVAVGEVLTIDVRCVRSSDALSTYDTETKDAAGALVATATMTILHAERPPDAQ